jgi:trehalose-6-phosphate synthase
MPLGIDFELWQRLAKSSRPMAEALSLKHGFAGRVLLGIDRLDYSKGVLEKLDGIDQFLSANSYWLKRMHYVQISQPPQSEDANFSSYALAVVRKIAEINKKFSQEGWEPIIHIQKQLNQNELAAWYQAGDILVVNSIRDGLNLIAKEFVACREDEQGVLLLSKKAGCAAELAQGAIEIEPNSPVDFANGLSRALKMESEEQRRRMTAMRRVVSWNRLHDWALGFLREAITK